MAGVLEDLFRMRTERNTLGTITGEWDHVLLWRDLDRLAAEGAVEAIDSPATADPDPDSRQRKYFRDLTTNEIYMYVGGSERGSPEFRKVG
jgi:hypothetical protein